ncbi:MAG: carboxylesterase family protein [Chitinophagales bacterium]|nr:carboxylesterase family protein [Chitinophagales bacterium]MCZ2393778.1 carboxylesterase family protein [Chitinophagales bacterium]
MKILKYFLLLSLLLLFKNSFAECGDRYKEIIFPTYTKYSDIQYGTNLNNLGEQQDLYLDIFTPPSDWDSITHRPIVLLMHGGAYVAGSKNSETIQFLCKELALRGYVAVAVQYRLEKTNIDGIEPILQFADKVNWYKAIIRSMQDIKGAIKFLKSTVAENNPYGLDTNNITLYGSSAGAIGVIHTAYLDANDEVNLNWGRAISELGGLEGNTNASPFSSLNTVRNIIVDSGALADLNWIGDKNDIDVLGLHHDKDPSVPSGNGCFYTAACHLGRFDGLKRYGPYLENIGARIEKVFVSGVGHPVDDLDRNFALEKTVHFLYASQCKYDTTIFNVPTSIKYNKLTGTLNIFPNPSQQSFQINTSFSSPAVLQIFALNGQLLYEQNYYYNSTKDIQHNLNNGLYLITLKDSNHQLFTAKLIVQH